MKNIITSEYPSGFPYNHLPTSNSRKPVGTRSVLRVLVAIMVTTVSLTILASSLTAAQWSWQNPVPTANPLRGVFFVNANTGWAVGDFGEISKTTDGGATWSLQRIGTDPQGQRGRQAPFFTDVFFIDSNTGWVVGSNPHQNQDVSTILKTTDGGAHWVSQRVGSGNIVCVHFVDYLSGWAVDAPQNSGEDTTILKTTDGGTNWVVQSILPYDISKIFFKIPASGSLNQTRGWAVGAGGVILKTSDGGAFWQPKTSGTTQVLSSINFVNDSDGWVVGFDNTSGQAQSIILKTSDAGETWSAQTSGTSLSLRSVKFLDSQTGVAVGGNGDNLSIILRTVNGGQSWNGQTSEIGESNRLMSIAFGDQYNGWAVGLDGVIMKTTNGGGNWTSLSTGTRAGLRGIHMLSDTKGFITGGFGLDGALLKTTDGVNWTPKILGGPALSAVRFATDSIGWAAGNNGTIIKTTDGGETWSTPQPSNTTETLLALQFVSTQEGWAAGDNGVLRHTTNGGTTWSTQSTGGNWLISSLYFFNNSFGWGAGYGGGVPGIILKTTDGGITWSQFTAPVAVTSIHFSDANNGWAVGNDIAGNGMILRTTNGGASWSTQLTSSSYLTSVQALSPTVGWAVGGDTSGQANILKTTNGGQSWTTETPVFGDMYLGVHFTNEVTGWVVGGHGAILHTGCVACSITAGEDEPLELKPEDSSVLDALFVPVINP